nr:MAG TPA: hypothetical protein [Bacteriophage sp.]
MISTSINLQEVINVEDNYNKLYFKCCYDSRPKEL